MQVNRDGERLTVQEGPQSITLLVSDAPELLARVRDAIGLGGLNGSNNEQQAALLECAGISARALECIVERLEAIGMSINLLVQKGG